MRKINPDHVIVKKNKDIAWREIDGEVVIIPLIYKKNMDDEIFVLNKTGSYVWNTIKHSTSLSDIIKAVDREFKTSEDIAEKDIIFFIEDLEKKKLISTSRESF